MNAEFTWDKKSLSEAYVASGEHSLIDRGSKTWIEGRSVRWKIAAGPLGLVSEILESAGEAGIDIIINLINKLLIGVVPGGCMSLTQFSTTKRGKKML